MTGKGAQSEIVRNKISEDLEQSIDLFNPLDIVELPTNLALDSKNLNMQLSEVVGEAVREYNLIENSTSLNLVPLNVKQELKFIRQKPILAVSALIFALFPWFIYFGLSEASKLKNDDLRELKLFAHPYHDNESIISENKANAEMLSRSISQVEGLVDTKTNWIQFFADLQESIYSAKDVWIDDLTVLRQSLDEDPFEDDYGYSDYDEVEDADMATDYEVIVKGKMLVRQSADEINQDVLADRELNKLKQVSKSLVSFFHVVSQRFLGKH